MKRALLVLPEFDVSAEDIRRCKDSLDLELGGARTQLVAEAAHVARWIQAGFDVKPYDIEEALAAWDCVAFIYHQPPCAVEMPPLAKALQERAPYPVYGFNFRGYKAECQPFLPKDRMKHSQCSGHIFSRLAPELHYEGYSYFFPYGALWHGPGRGPLNAFGHRITLPLETVAARDATTKLVAVFGGSAVFSVECLHHEMFTQLLQERLNALAEAQGSSTRFIVLNFGAPRQVVLDEIMTYVLHAVPLKPDIVIAHDGFNDFMFGPPGDPALVGEARMIYQTLQELWSHQLYPSWDVSARRPAREMMAKVQSAPELVLRAYRERKDQFEAMARGLGAAFIHGLQPVLYSKTVRGAGEDAYAKALENGEDWGVFMNHALIVQLMERFVRHPSWHKKNNKIDFHALFKQKDSTENFFTDLCHLTPRGDQEIAAHYADYIAAQGWITERETA